MVVYIVFDEPPCECEQYCNCKQPEFYGVFSAKDEADEVAKMQYRGTVQQHTVDYQLGKEADAIQTNESEVALLIEIQDWLKSDDWGKVWYMDGAIYNDVKHYSTLITETLEGGK